MIERIDVGNVEVSSSAKGLVFTIGDDLVRKLIGYVTNSCSDKTNVMIDINELIDVLNQEKYDTLPALSPDHKSTSTVLRMPRPLI